MTAPAPVDLNISRYWAANGGTPALWDKVSFDGIVMPGRASIGALSVGRKTTTRSPAGADGASYRDKGREPSKFVVTLELRTGTQWDRWLELAPMFNYRTELAPTRPASTRHVQQTAADAANERAKQRGELVTGTDQQIVRGQRTQTEAVTAAQAAQWQQEHDAVALPASTTTPAARRRQRRPVSITHPMCEAQNVHRVYVDDVGLKDPKSSRGFLVVELHCLEYRPLPPPATPSASTTPNAGRLGAVTTALGTGAPSNTQHP